jgi:hypothetical protein
MRKRFRDNVPHPMNKNFFTSLSALAVFSLMSAAVHAADVGIVNGDFSSGAGTATVSVNTAPGATNPSGTGLPTAWGFRVFQTGSGSNIATCKAAWAGCGSGTVPANYEELRTQNYNRLGDFAEIYQSITLPSPTSAGTLTLNWSDAGRSGIAAGQYYGNCTYEILLKSTVDHSIVQVLGIYGTGSNQAWKSHTASYSVAAGGTYYLAFRNITTTGNTPLQTGSADALMGLANISASYVVGP